MSGRWGDETTLKFVQLYRDHENLWNMFSPDYRNRRARSASMQAIASALNIPTFTVKDAPKKIKALRSTYYLELAKIEKRRRSGVATDLVYKPSLPWFDDMSYIIMKTANVKEKETCSDSEIGNQEASETRAYPNPLINSNTQRCFNNDLSNDIMSEPPTSEEQPVSTPRGGKTTLQPSARARNKGKKRRFETATDAVRKTKDSNEKMGTSTLTKSTVIGKDDECDIMGKHIAIQLRELPVQDRVRANFEIQKILMDYRLRNISPVPTK